MAMDLKEIVISSPGEAVQLTRTEVPDYVQRAIAESVERGKRDARAAATRPGGTHGSRSSQGSD